MKRLYSGSGALSIVLVVLFIVGSLFTNALSQRATMLSPGHSLDRTASSSSSVSSAVPGPNLTLGEDHDATHGTYLVGYNGKPVYTYDQDLPGISTCMGACLTQWKPYSVSTSTGLVAEYPIAGKISTLTRADGTLQVLYDGQPLYFLNQPASTTQEVGLSWHLARP